MSSAITISTGTVNIGGNLMSLGGGNISVGAGTLTVTGNFEAMGCALEIATGTVDVGGNFNIDGGMFGSVTFTDAGSLYLGGTVIDLGNFTAGTGTVIYDSITIAQDVLDVDYYNLSIEGSTAKTLTADLGASDDRINNLTVDGSAANLDLNTSGYDIYANSLDIISTPEADPDPDPYLQPDLEFSTAGYIWDNGDGRATILNISGISNISGDITTQGTQTYTGAVTLTGDAYFQASDDIEFTSTISGSEDTGSNDLIIVSEGGTLTFGDTVGNLGKIADIGIASDDISITAAVTATSGDIILANLTPNATIGLAGGAGTYQLSNDEFNLLNAESNTVAIGSSATNTGTITIGLDNNNLNAGSRFSNLHLTTLNEIDATAGSITVENLAITAGGNVEISHANTDVTTLAATFTNTGNLIFEDANTLTIGEVGDVTGITMNDGSVSITTGGQLDIDQVITAAGDGNGITVTGNQDIVISNKNLTTAAGDINLNNSAITLDTGAVQLSTGGASAGDILIGGEVSGTQALTLNAGTGSVDLDSFSNVSKVTILDVTGSTGINIAGDIYTSSTQDYNSAVTLTNDVIFDADDNNITFDSTIAGINPDDLTIDAGTGTITFSGIVGGYNQINAIDIDAGTLTQKGAITAQGQLDIDVTSSYNMAHDLTGGEGGSGDTNITLTDSESTFTTTADKILSSVNGALTITADNMTLTGVITATDQTVTLQANAESTTIAIGGGEGDVAGNFSLTDAELDTVEATTLVVGRDNSGAMEIGTLTQTNKNLTLISGGAITQTNAISVSGAMSLTATGNDITLNNLNNIFSSEVSIGGGNNVQIFTSGALALGDATVTGNYTLTTLNGAVTQSNGTALDVSGTTGITAGGDNNVTLNNADNDFANINISGRDVTIQDTDDLRFSGQTSTISGNLLVTAAGAIEQVNPITVSGTSGFTAGAGNNIILDNSSNIFTGAITITTGNNVAFQNIGSIVFAASTISGTFDVTTTSNGNVTQSGALSVTGATTINASTGSGNVTLDNASNDFSSVGITSGNDVNLRDTNALTLNASTVSGDLTVTTDSTLSLAATTVSGALDLITSGEITQSGALSVTGTTDISAGSGNAITLDNGSNNFTGNVSISSGGTTQLTEGWSGLSLGAITLTGDTGFTTASFMGITLNGDISSEDAHTYSNAVTLGADVALTTTDADINFSDTVNGEQTLTLNSGSGAITFTGMVGGMTGLVGITITNSGGVNFSGPPDPMMIGMSTASLGTVDISNVTGGTVSFEDYSSLTDLITGNEIDGTGNDYDISIAVETGMFGGNVFTVTNSVIFLNKGSLALTPGTQMWMLGTITFTGGIQTTGNDDNPSEVTISGNLSTTDTAMTLGAITLIDPLEMGVNLSSASSDGGAITLGTITGNEVALTVNAGTNTVSISTMDDIGEIDITGSDGITLNGDIESLTGGIAFNNSTTLADDIELTSASITFSDTLDGDQQLTLTAAAEGSSVTFSGEVGGDTALTNLIIGSNASSATKISTLIDAAITTSGTQTYSGGITLGSYAFADVTLEGTTVTFQSTIDSSDDGGGMEFDPGPGGDPDSYGSSLTVDASANAVFEDVIGGATALSSLTVTGSSSIGANITTSNEIRGTGNQTYTGAVTLTGNQTLTSTDGTIEFSSTIDNDDPARERGLVTVGTTIFGGAIGGGVNGALASVDVTGAVTIGGNITTSDTQDYTSTFELTDNTVLTASDNDITFGGNVLGDYKLTVAAGTGDINFDSTVGATTALSGLVVESAAALAFDSNVNVDVEGIDITAGTVTFNNTVTTTTNGSVEITNSGLLLIAAAAEMDLDGAFTQNGAGFVATAGDITTTNDNISFETIVTLTGATAFSTGAGIGDITFTDQLDGAQDIDLTAGTGNIFFTGAVGSTTEVGAITINSAVDVTAESTIEAESFVQIAGTGITTFNGDITTTEAEGLDITANNGIILDGINIVASAGVVTFNDDVNITTDAVDIDAADNITFAGALTSTDAQDLTLASDENIDFDEAVGYGDDNELGAISITTAADVTADGTIEADSFVQTAGTGTTTFNGDITTTEAEGVDIAADTGIVLDGINIVASAGVVTFNDDVNITTAAVDIDAADTIAFAGALTSTDAQDLTLASDANIYFDEAVGSGDDNELGSITIDTAVNVTADSTIEAASFVQSAGTGTTTFNGALNTNTSAGINLTGNIFNINSTITTTNNGIVEITNAGLLTIASAADMTLDGAFTQNGAGLVSTAGDITTSNDDISFATAVTLTGDVALDTGTGTTTFLSTINGANTLDITGNAVFNDQVGNTTALTSLSVSGTSSVANNITTTGAQSYTGLVTLTGVADTTKTFKTTNSDINFTGGVTNANSHLTVSAGSGTVTLGSGKSIDINGLLTKAGSGNFVTNGGDITAGGLSVTAGIFNSANAAGNWDINGDVAISTNATLNVTSATATVSGNWTNSGTFNSQTGTVNLNGSSEQSITSNGSNFYDLALNNSAGATINDDASINNTLTLTAGLVTLGNSNLTVTGLIKGIGGGVTKADFSSSNMILTNGSGKVKKGVSGAGNYFMPIGTKAIYSPINFYFPTGTFAPNAYVEASVVAEKYSENKSTTNYLNKYWITNTENISNFKASVSFYYAASDVVGKEISIIGAMYNNNVETSLDKVDTANQPITGTIKDIGVFTGISAPSSPVEEPKPEAEPAEATPTINNPTQTPTDSPWQPIIDSPGENSGDVKDITDNLPLAAPGLSSQKSNNNYASSPTITIGGVIINNTAAGDGGADPSIVGGVDIANNAVGADGVDFSQTVDGVFGGTAIIGSEVSIVGIEGASEAMKSNNDSGETNTAAKDGIIKNAKDVKIDSGIFSKPKTVESIKDVNGNSVEVSEEVSEEDKILEEKIVEDEIVEEELTTSSKKSDSKKTQDTTHNKKHIGKEINNESQLLVSIDDLYFNKLEQQGKTYVDDILGDVDYSNIEYLTKGKYDIFKSDFDKAIDQFIAA